jgi:hypothetical protein
VVDLQRSHPVDATSPPLVGRGSSTPSTNP